MTEPNEILNDEASSPFEAAMRSAQARAGRYYAALVKIAAWPCQEHSKWTGECEQVRCPAKWCAKREAMLTLEAEVKPFASGGILPPGPSLVVGETPVCDVIPKRADEVLPWCPVCRKRVQYQTTYPPNGVHAPITICQTCGVHFDPKVSEQLVGKRCAAEFKSDACGYSGADTHCDKTYAECLRRGNGRRFGGYPPR